MRYKILLTFFLCFWANSLSAQETTFSSTGAELATEMTSFFEAYAQKEVQAELTNFNTSLQDGTLSDKQVGQLADLLNSMVERKMKVIPVYYNLISVVNKINISEDKAIFDSWYTVTKQLADDQKVLKYTKYKAFLEFCLDFVNDNILYASGKREWRSDGGQRKFVWNEGRPFLELTEVSLYGTGTGDSTYILKTDGLFDIQKDYWVGQNGKVNWLRGQTDFYERAYAILKNYEMDMRRPEYKAKGVEFYHDEFFKQPLTGDFADRIQRPSNGNYTYPRFISDDRKLSIENVVPGVDFEGGFGLNGSKILIIGDTTTAYKAAMRVNDNEGETKMMARANSFSIKSRASINAVDTEISLYFKNDSIYHPNLDLSYDVAERNLRVARSSVAISQIGYVSSFHKIEAEVDIIRWNLNDTIMYLKSATQDRTRPAIINSWDYYNPELVQPIRKAIRRNPISVLGAWQESTFQNKISASAFASQLGGQYKVTDIIGVIFDMVDAGFCYYNPVNQEITIRPKAVLYSKAEVGQTDYDNIILFSKSQKDNMYLDLNTADLTVVGTDFVVLSDSQRVRLYPYDKIVDINENRTIKSVGDVVVGNADLINGKHQFNYEEFSISIDTTDRLVFYVEEQEQFRSQTVIKRVKLKTPIERVTGKVYIAFPGNKAGLSTNSKYPYLETTGPSYIFYEKEALYKSAYNKDRFFFELDPFVFENLGKTPRDNFGFPGRMVFGEIFPEVRQEAKLQEDLTLGVDIKLEDDNLPLYADRATYGGTVNFSNLGLTGSGSVDYLTATLKSREFVFLPDSMMTQILDSVVIRKEDFNGQPYPNVVHAGIKMKWFPYRDSLMLNSRSPFAMFENKSQFVGELNLTTEGLLGNGSFLWSGANFTSDILTFDQENVYSDSLDMNIQLSERSVIKSQTDVKAEINVYDQIGLFQASPTEEKKVVRIDLPQHQYAANLDKIEWDYKLKTIRFINNNDKTNYFVSAHPEQKALRFNLKEAVLNTEDEGLEVNISGVPYINVADAQIIPKGGDVTLLPNAVIEKLTESNIVIDTVKSYHLITNAVVDIYSRTDFKATGEYLYRSANMDDQVIVLDLIESREVSEEEYLKDEETDDKKSKKKKKEKENEENEEIGIEGEETVEDTEGEGEKEKGGLFKKDDTPDPTRKRYFQTFSETALNEDDKFRLDPKTFFKGNVYLESDRKYLLFDGFANIQLTSPYIKADYFAFKSEINPNNLNLDLSSPVGENGQSLAFGLYFDYYNLKPIAKFLNVVDTLYDMSITPVSGTLSYDVKRDLYRLGDSDRLVGNKEKGNVLAFFDNEDQKFITEGEMQLTRDLGQFTLDVAGRAALSLVTDSIKLTDMVIGIDFPLEKKAYTFMIEDLKSLLAENDEINYLSKGFSPAIASISEDEKQAQEVVVNLAKEGYFRKPDKSFDYNFLFVNVNMEFNKDIGSYISNGPFGLGYGQESYINRKMTQSYIEVAPRDQGDAVFIYIANEDIETGSTAWYFLQYRNGIMEVLSSNVAFNDLVLAVKESKRMQVDKKNPDNTFIYGLASYEELDGFLYRMQEAEKSREKNAPKEEEKE